MPSTYKHQFNKKYGFHKDTPHSVKEIAALTGYNKDGLEIIKKKGLGAFWSNPESVRAVVKKNGGADRWAMARVYAAVNKKSKAHKIDSPHLRIDSPHLRKSKRKKTNKRKRST